MMMMEAIRMSLVSEEERKRKEEQEAKERASQEQRELSVDNNDDTNRTRLPPVSGLSMDQDRQGGVSSTTGKGKAIDRGHSSFDPSSSSIHHAPSSVASTSQATLPVGTAVSDEVARPPSPARGAVNTDGKFAFGSLDAMVGSDGETDDGRLPKRRENASGEIR